MMNFIFSPNCSYSARDVQEAGRADIFNYGKIYNIKNTTILGTTEYESAGYSLDFGYLYGGDSLYMAVGYPKKNHTLEMCNIVRLRKQVFV
jgi:hypothetical protein